MKEESWESVATGLEKPLEWVQNVYQEALDMLVDSLPQATPRREPGDSAQRATEYSKYGNFVFSEDE